MSTSKGTPEPPSHLSARARGFWRATVKAYNMEPGHLELLRRLTEAMDRADECRRLLAKEGLTVTNRYGEVRPHPAAAIERDSRNAIRSLLQALRLGDEAEASAAGSSLARARWKVVS